MFGGPRPCAVVLDAPTAAEQDVPLASRPATALLAFEAGEIDGAAIWDTSTYPRLQGVESLTQLTDAQLNDQLYETGALYLRHSPEFMRANSQAGSWIDQLTKSLAAEWALKQGSALEPRVYDVNGERLAGQRCGQEHWHRGDHGSRERGDSRRRSTTRSGARPRCSR